jgi:hypothetical protein
MHSPEGGDAGAGGRAGPHAGEDSGGDPLHRHVYLVHVLTLYQLVHFKQYVLVYYAACC